MHRTHMGRTWSGEVTEVLAKRAASVGGVLGTLLLFDWVWAYVEPDDASRTFKRSDDDVRSEVCPFGFCFLRRRMKDE